MNGNSEPKLIFPGLAGFYASVSDLWYPMIRVAIGAILFMHGYFKLANLGIARVAANFGTNYGLPMPTFLAYAAVFLVEGLGLLFRKRWAEWLTVVVTASFVPVEIYEMVARESLLKGLVIAVNVAAVAYLLWRLRRDKHWPWHRAS